MTDPFTGLDFTDIEESQRVEGLRFIINSPAWQDFFKPALDNACQFAHRMLVMEPAQRKGAESDALLRARIQVLESVMNLGPNLIREYDEARLKREMQEAQAESYAERAAHGRMGLS